MGMRILVIILFCIFGYTNTQEVVSSDGNTCGKLDRNGVSTFTIQAKAPQLSKTEEIDMILIQFDSKRKLPISSTIFMDELNQLREVSRDGTEPFGPLPCPELPVIERQQNCSGGFSMTSEQKEKAKPKYTWDRGHLTPVNPMRFSLDATYKTFYCVNIAPQDPYTNQNPWRDIEVGVQNKLKRNEGSWIQTGVCSDDNEEDGPVTHRGWIIPKCFWKLVCYKDTNGNVQVVGFIGDNTLVGLNDKSGQVQRDENTFTPKSQDDILKLVSRPQLVSTAWKTAYTKLLQNRNGIKNKIPSPKECSSVLSLSEDVAKEWRDWMKAGVRPNKG